MLEKLLPGDEAWKSDPGMSAFTRRASDHFLTGLQRAESDVGPRYAAETAEAYVDAGARYIDGERVSVPEEEVTYLASMPSAMSAQNL